MTLLDGFHASLWLEILLPTVFWTLNAAVILYCAHRAIRSSPAERAADRHFVASAAVVSVLAALALSWVVRALLVEDNLLYFLPYERWYASLWGAVVVWGGVGFVCRFLGGSIWTATIIRAGERNSDGRLAQLLFEAQCELHARRKVQLIVSPACKSPFCVGVIRPKIVLPTNVHDLCIAEQRTILFHELAHIKRWDPLSEFCCQLLGIVLWWNPLYWVTVRWLESLREQACDEIVVSNTANRDGYIRLLLSYLETAPRMPLNLAFARVGIASRSVMHDRLEAMPTHADLPALYRFAGEMTRGQLVLILCGIVGLLVLLDATAVAQVQEFIGGIPHTIAVTQAAGMP